MIEWLEWEQLLNPFEFRPTVHGQLPDSVRAVKIHRNTDLTLRVLATGTQTSAFSPVSANSNLRLGERYPTPLPIEGYHPGLRRAVLEGLTIHSKSTTGEGNFEFSGTAQALRLETDAQPDGARFEWLTNYSLGNFVPPRRTNRVWSSKLTIERDSLPALLIDLDKPFPASDFSTDHFELNVKLDGTPFKLRIGEPASGVPKTLIPGYVWWNSHGGPIPTEDQRSCILAGVSFLLGRQIATIGHTTFSSTWTPAEKSSIAPRLITKLGRSFGPPVQLSPPGEENAWLSEDVAGRIVAGFIHHAKSLDLEHALWRYWVGLSSPLDVQPAHFGAALEALRTGYFDSLSYSNTRLLPGEVWKPAKEAFAKALADFKGRLEKVPHMHPEASDPWDRAVAEIAPGDRETALRIYSNKINQFNDKSGNMQWEDFFTQLKLPSGDVETSALRQRNGPAHGSRYRGDYSVLAASVHALQALFNRCILRITDGADHYIDYSTYGFPTRRIEEPLGGPEGDGKPAKII
ncbi:hypothetical protein G4177_36410 [Corallococcus sp. ZKHCc1 1396]|uniref:ApeA N-terminal domain-containing protein n=1 Tax=Corallococcus soli TaxID=2710757 RepID=A0ABR9Q0H8_9BACT|nr:hypothetical protein [Corallococcus soli]MBE4753644.1 hypothetical protein [Corallococcus soli]